MSVALICCRMLESELKRICDDENISVPIYWIDAGFHNNPEKLHEKLQNLFDSLPRDITRVILLFSLCGQAVLGLKTENFDLIMPRTDDCIALLLGGNDKKIDNSGTFFLTEKWLDDEKSITNEYKYALQKYGPSKCERIFKRQFAHYSVLGILDTGCYDVNSLLSKTASISKLLELNQRIIPTDCNMLKQLVCLSKLDVDTLPNPLPDNLIYIERNSSITYEMFKNDQND